MLLTKLLAKNQTLDQLAPSYTPLQELLLQILSSCGAIGTTTMAFHGCLMDVDRRPGSAVVRCALG
jgi:hypothetical protein